MPLAPKLAELIAAKLAHAGPPSWQQPIAEVRAAFARLWVPALTGPPQPVARVEDHLAPTAAGSIPVRVFVPATAAPPPVIAYCHGGGWVKGGIAETDAFCRRLAHTTARIVVSIGYRLAPEHPFPAPLEDAYHATAWAFAQAEALGGRSEGFVMAGESAGGNMATVICRLARQRGGPEIARQVLLQPWLDLTLSQPSLAMPETECLVPRADLAWYADCYAGPARDRRDPLLSPLWSDDLAGLPRALIIAAEQDSLRDEAALYAQRLGTAGVPVAHACYPGMVHGFLQMAGLVEAAQAAIDQIAAFLDGPGVDGREEPAP